MKSKGFALISAIIILVLFSIISAYLINIFAVTQYTVSNSLRSSRAYYAAKAGLDWGIFQVVQNPGQCFTNQSISMNQGGLNMYTAQISCSSKTFTEGNQSFQMFTIVARGFMGNFPDIDYVSKSISTTVTLGNN